MSKASALAALKAVPITDIQSAVHPQDPKMAGTQPGLLTPNVPVGTVVNVPVDTITAAEPKDELQSSRLAIFAKKEAAIQKEREALKREREEWEKGDRAKSSEVLSKAKLFEETFSKDKLAAFRMLGYSDTDLINMMSGVEEGRAAGTGSLSQEEVRKLVKEETNRVRQEFEEKEKQKLSQNNEQMVRGLKSDIKDTIKEMSEKYEYCAFEGDDAQAKAYQIIVDNLEATKSDEKPYGELLSIEQALDVAEEYYEKRAEAMDALKKRQARGQAAQTEAPTSVKEGEPPKSNMSAARPRTLTNSVAASTAASNTVQFETRQQKKERLAKYLSSLNDKT